MRTPNFWRAIACAIGLAIALAACGSSTPGDGEPTTSDPVESTAATAPCSTVTENACGLDDGGAETDPGGEVTVIYGDTTYQFAATRCLVNTEVFVVDGESADGATTVAIRHASPPTKEVPEPSMSYLLIEPEPAFESLPASVTFDTYDPATGVATGAVDEGVTFTVRCDR